jgi:hypothetical protein
MIYQPVVSSNASVHTFSHGAINYIISPAIPSHFICQLMVSWTEAGQTPRLTRIDTPHPIWSILTWHERGNVLPAMNKTFSGSKTKTTHVPVRATGSKRLSLESFSAKICQKDTQSENLINKEFNIARNCNYVVARQISNQFQT